MNLSNIFIEGNIENLNPKCILGGSCICFAKGNPLRLTIQDLVDSLIPCIVASQKEIPVYLYFQSLESDMMSEVFKFDKAQSNYSTMKKYLYKGIVSTLYALTIKEPIINFIDTYDQKTSNYINESVLMVKNNISLDQLYGLYSENKNYPKNTSEEEIMLEVYYRNLTLYYPKFIEKITSINKDYLIIENNTQRKAIQLIQSIDSKPIFQMLNYESPKNRQGKEMCMGNRNHKIELRSTDEQILVRSDFKQNPEVNNFYKSIFNNISIEDIMNIWKNSIKS